MTAKPMKDIFVTVAEHSADTHAGNMVRALLSRRSDIRVTALGGSQLKAAGAELMFDTVSNARMGLGAFLRAREIQSRLRAVRERYTARRPDLHICCDSWTMNVHFAKLAKEFGVPVLYYIAPQAWASREGRVVQLAALADRVACILPFEEAFFRTRGVNAFYVGHPLLDEPRVAAIRTDSSLVALPCGSRKSVVKANLPRQLEVARRLLNRHSRLHFVIPTTDATHDLVASIVNPHADVRDRVRLVRNDFDGAVREAMLALCVSGTATLQLAVLNVPMVVVYHASRFLWHAVGRWMVKTRTYCGVNLIANDGRDDRSRHIVREIIPWFGDVEPAVQECLKLIDQPQALANQRKALLEVVGKIRGGAAIAVADMASEMLGEVVSS
jgi:lipid-A-disaccharide synthase